MQIYDIDFLHGCSQPTIVMIHQDVNGRHIKTHELSLRDREFVKVTPIKFYEAFEKTTFIILLIIRYRGNKTMSSVRPTESLLFQNPFVVAS